eukprot:Skav202782  [mRNA]  locus=scaffold326:465908:467764:+ [translate_table: standard]
MNWKTKVERKGWETKSGWETSDREAKVGDEVQDKDCEQSLCTWRVSLCLCQYLDSSGGFGKRRAFRHLG